MANLSHLPEQWRKSGLSSCSSEIEDAAIWNHVANSLIMEIADLDNVASCDGTSLFDRVAAAVEASCTAGGLRGDVFGAIEEVLEGEWIDYSSVGSECSNLRCALDVLTGQIAGSNTITLFCETLSIASGSDIFHVVFSV